jgi:hypothetical protein
MKSKNSLFLFGKRGTAGGRRTQTLHLSIRMTIKETVVIKGTYHSCQLRKLQNLVPHPALKIKSICREVKVDFDAAIDHKFCIRQIMEEKKEENEAEVHHLFIDFKKAYDSVRREVLL